jgi:hypothetical protein
MVMSTRKLNGLEKIARLRAERDLAAFSALAAGLHAAQEKAEGIRAELGICFGSAAPSTLAQARFANHLAHQLSRDLDRSQVEIERLTSQVDNSRRQAAQELGRAEALRQLSRAASRPKGC